MRIILEKALNRAQLSAVKILSGPLLILAGAGSGKTRVITYRMAYLIEQGAARPSILALTFTNKAAREMAQRIRDLTGETGKKDDGPVVATFHAFGVRVLRQHITRLGYKQGFSIFDEADRHSLIKECARYLGRAASAGDAYTLANLFSGIKTGRISWNDTNQQHSPLFQEYQSHLKAYNSVDFDDLILLPIRLLTEYPEILTEYRARYEYIMVDEFQDTSANQFTLMKLLADGSRNICVVGDDDQSIYSWRGACFENILRFEESYPEVTEIRLEHNYRSTAIILEAANQLIENNSNRKSKKLWTSAGGGELIKIFHAANDKEEGEYIAERIKSLHHEQRIPFHNFGVLVRANSLTRPIEEAFLAGNLPYQVSGGISFFQRKEVKDCLAYLRLMANPEDDISLLRIINIPRRGIGKKTIETLAKNASDLSCSLYSAISALDSQTDLTERTLQDLKDFNELIESHGQRLLSGRNMAKTFLELIEEIDYWGYLLSDGQKPEAAKWKYMNVESLAASLEEYEEDPDNLEPGIQAYLNRITLLSREREEGSNDDRRINLMTIHAAKGLEFNTVFVAGVEQDIIPHTRSLAENGGNLEEERRLFYVAITRAMHRLYLSNCERRRRRGKLVECCPSPFLAEIPTELTELEQEDYLDKDSVILNFENLRKKFT